MTLNEEESEGVNNDEEPSFRSWTAYVITKPKAWYCHLRLGVMFVRYSIQELQETTPIVTKQSWSLDKACCGLRNNRAEFAVGGEDSIEPRQYTSGLVCSILGVKIGCLV